MKMPTMFCALLAVVAGAQIISARIKGRATHGKPEATEICLEGNGPVSGMFFSSGYVVGEYECGGMYCIRYHDADANLFDAEIPVDRATYESVIGSIESGEKMAGHLVLCEGSSSCETGVFTFVKD